MKCKPSKYIKSILKAYIISALIVSIFFASGLNLENLNEYFTKSKLSLNIKEENATSLSLGAYKRVSDDYNYVVTPTKDNAKKASLKRLSRGNQSISSYINEQNQASGVPTYFEYYDVNTARLRKFLVDRNSLLAEEPYFSTIISTAKEFNLNPLILFSITGVEQSFVPKSNTQAYKIANNPYNVFYSWQHYNTDIKDSSRIAARTVLNLCKNKPANTDAFYWINKKYAENQNWNKVVSALFKELLSYTV
ncbi:hypothetical protein [Clostridium peptidivorans]|uniref:hypothetical protein n=1 Tax=Clostridium peptidivorans TaxID=100174 RepID=UPI000BE38D99